MNTQITTQKQVSRKNLSIWLNSTEISLKNLAEISTLEEKLANLKAELNNL